MHANYLDTLDWGILIAYFLILIGIGIWAQPETQKRQQPFSCRAFPEVASHRFLHVGNQCGPFHADSLRQCRIYHRYRFR